MGKPVKESSKSSKADKVKEAPKVKPEISKKDAKKSKEHSKDKKDEKKKKKKAESSSEDEHSEEEVAQESKKDKKSSKKRSSEEPKKEKKKSKTADAEMEEVEEEEESNFDKFELSEKTKAHLRSKGIKTLFNIQAESYPHIYSGKDVIGKAKTGTGKTIAFLLPVLERLTKEGVRKERGHKVLIVTPTRELAKQIDDEITRIAPEWTHACIYGGTEYGPQHRALRDGVDVLVACPGRLQDHIDKGSCKLSAVRVVILDEADEMLNRGFQEPTEQILNSVKTQVEPTKREVQTLLFSATIPIWVKTMIQKFMKKDHVVIDQIGKDRNQTSTGVTHMAISCGWQQRPAVLADLVRCYGGFRGRSIVFTDTKAEANELALNSSIQSDCGVLHGDISQQQREVTLQSFRDAKLRCLIATDVAARGLDIPEVDLVVLCHPPKDPDTYVHRSGRTGRAGRKGTCIVMYQPKEKSLLDYIEKRAGHKFQKIGPPQPEEIVRVAASESAFAISMVQPKALEVFRSAAMELVEQKGAVDAVAACLAVLSGNEKAPMSRSLLSSEEGATTLLFLVVEGGEPINANNFVWGQLRRILPESISSQVKGVKLLQDGMGAAFDVPEAVADECVAANCGPRFRIEAATELPDLQGQPASQYGGFGGGGGYGGRGGGSFGGRGGQGGRGGGRGGASPRTPHKNAPVNDDCRVFVGGLPQSKTSEMLVDEIRDSLQSIGNITDVYVPKDYETGNTKGVAFITFATAGEAQKAVNATDVNICGKIPRLALAGARK